MERIPPGVHDALVMAIARREGNAEALAERFGYSTATLRRFVAENRDEIAGIAEQPTQPESAEPSPVQLDELWITNKFERLKRYQELAEILYKEIIKHRYEGAELAMAVREYRSYCTVVANELGQLLHRGAGDAGTGDVLSVDIQGIDMDALK